MADPESLVDEFAATPVPKRVNCHTCKLKNADAVNRALQRFGELRDSGTTSQSWNSFYRYVLVEKLEYPFARDAMHSHRKECLDIS